MILWGCNIHYNSDWFLVGRYFDIRTVSYLQTIILILQISSSSINSLRIYWMFVGLIKHWVLSRLDKNPFRGLIEDILTIHDYYWYIWPKVWNICRYMKMYKSCTLLRFAVKQLVLKSYLISKLLEVLKVNLKYRRKKEDDLIKLHFSLLHPFLYENLLAHTARSSTFT